jgi:hypothetical protein
MRARTGIRRCREQTIWQMFEAERPSLVSYAGRFDGFHAVPASVSKTCLVRFDNNKYSAMASAVGRPVEVRAYADRIERRQAGRVVGEHRRCFGRDQTVRSLALRAGSGARARGTAQWRAVQELGLTVRPGASPSQACRFRRWRPADGCHPIRSAERRAAGGGSCLPGGLARRREHSADVILNILARRREPPLPRAVMAPDALRLQFMPAADCGRYDKVRSAA